MVIIPTTASRGGCTDADIDGDPSHGDGGGVIMSRKDRTGRGLLCVGCVERRERGGVGCKVAVEQHHPPALMVVDSNGLPVLDEDGIQRTDTSWGRITADGAYYAKVGVAGGNVWRTHVFAADGGMTWSQAEVYAQDWAGIWLTISDQAEQDWLTANVGAFFRRGSALRTKPRKGRGRVV